MGTLFYLFLGLFIVALIVAFIKEYPVLGTFSLILVIALLIYSGIHKRKLREKTSELFKPEIHGLFDLSDNIRNHQMRNINSDITSGNTKILVVDKVKRAVDDVFFRLPKKLQAANRSEINTLVLTQRGEDVVGYYSHKGEATRLFCIVEIYDIKRMELVVLDTVWGSKPKSVITPGDETHGSYPDKRVVKYIKTFFQGDL